LIHCSEQLAVSATELMTPFVSHAMDARTARYWSVMRRAHR